MPHTSRSRIQQALEGGYVFVGDRPVKANYRIKPLEVVTLQLRRPRRQLEIIPEDIPLDIVYEDEYLLVVNKPAGLVVHPGHGNYTGTLVNALAYYLKDDPHYDPEDPRLGLVHRIDKDTSGLLVVAKRPETKAHLSRQFFEKTTKRTYRALVWGRFDSAEGTIVGNIGRDERDRLQMAVYPESAASRRGARIRYVPTCGTSGTRSSPTSATAATASYGAISSPATDSSSRTASPSARGRPCMPRLLASSIRTRGRS